MTTIASRLAFQARTRGAATAVVSDDITLSWAELCDLSLRASSLLRAKGIGRGDNVALLCGNRPAFLVAWFGLANIGAVTVSINTGLVGDGLRYQIAHCAVKAVIAERAILHAKAADLDGMFDEREVVAFDGEADLFGELAGYAPDRPFQGEGSDPVSIIYTSGTTGPPKGVLNCHEAFLAAGRWMTRFLNIVEADRIMIFLPLFHTNPQLYGVMSALESGCSIAIRPKFSVSRFFQDARRFECTIFTYVGTVLSMLTSRVKTPCRDHTLTRCVGGGCPSETWRIMQERFGIDPYELYGMTEIGGWVTGNSTEHYRFGSCGRGRPDMCVRIVDTRDNFVATGTPGEIVVRPKRPYTMLLGYWNNPQATWDASCNFWFHTGDIGALDEDGYLYFRGRLKEIIRRGGENISPFEIEVALLEHPDILDAAVVGVPDPIYGEEIKAVVVPRKQFDAGDLPVFLKSRIPANMVPRYVQFADRIPRTETQKIQRHHLRQNDTGTIDLRKDLQNA